MTTKTNNPPPGVNSDLMTAQTVWNSVTVYLLWFIPDIYNCTIVLQKLQHIFRSRTGDVSQNVLPFGSPRFLCSCYSVAQRLPQMRCSSRSIRHRCDDRRATICHPRMRCGGKLFKAGFGLRRVYMCSLNQQVSGYTINPFLYVFTRSRTSTVPLSKVRLAG